MSEAKKRPRPIIIGVTGGSGSGKTSVSRAIFDQLHGHSLMMLKKIHITRVKMMFRLKNGLKSTMIIPMPLIQIS